MANVITNPTWIKAKPHASAEKQVGDSDPSARTDVINRPVKGIVSVMTKWLETFHVSGTFDFTNTTSTVAYSGIGIIPCAASTAATPEQHGLYRENVVKGWCQVSANGTTINDSFNVASVTDTGVGDLTVVWDRDFANQTYVVHVTVAQEVGSRRDAGQDSATAPVVGSTRCICQDSTPARVDPYGVGWFIAVIGDQ